MLSLNLLLIDSHQDFRKSAQKYLLSCRIFKSVQAADSYSEGMLLTAGCCPDLLLIDSAIFFENPGLIEEIEKIKYSNPTLEVLVLFLFQEDYMDSFQRISSPVSGILFKEKFAEGLFEYLSVRKISSAGSQDDSSKGGIVLFKILVPAECLFCPTASCVLFIKSEVVLSSYEEQEGFR